MVSIYICQKFFGDVNYVSCFVVVFTHGTWNILKTPNQKGTLPRKNTYSRWFKVPFSSPSWRSLNPLKGSRFHHPKKVTNWITRFSRRDRCRLSFLKRPKPLLERYQRFLTESLVDVGAPQIFVWNQVFCGHSGCAWMSQEVSKWLVNGL